MKILKTSMDHSIASWIHVNPTVLDPDLARTDFEDHRRGVAGDLHAVAGARGSPE